MENSLDIFDNNIFMKNYTSTDDYIYDINNIVETAQDVAYHSVDYIMVQRNWYIGKRIAEQELQGKDRAEYGSEVIKTLSGQLLSKYDQKFDKSTLYSFLRFYKYFPSKVGTVCPLSENTLSWSHYRILIRVHATNARNWYAKEAYEQTWSVKTLQRNVHSDYYFRLLKTQHIDNIKNNEIVESDKIKKLEYIKNPIIAEFLGLSTTTDVNESKLESAIITNIQKFLMELGKGYAFIARQQHVKTEKEDYYIDLVFYNYILKCFVLIDLKTNKITHQDVGQMDMYIRMYDELKRGEGDNPTLGIILCSETDEDIARYSVLKGNEQLFASKYKLYLPSEDELRNEIEVQKTIFKLQQQEKDEVE